MKKYAHIFSPWSAAIIMMLMAATIANAAPPPASGRVVNGFRVLTLESTDIPAHLTVYRGDYVQFIVNQGGGDATDKDSGTWDRNTTRF